ncbi:hypothetical protein [Streptomyces sp. NPDC001948]
MLILSCASVLFSPTLPDASAADVCDLPGCSLLEKGIDKAADIGKEMTKPLSDFGGKVSTAYDLASDPIGYFSEKFAQTSGKLIQELGREIKE